MSTTIDTETTATQARWICAYDPATGTFVVLRNEHVLDHVRSYLEYESLKADFETWTPTEGETP